MPQHDPIAAEIRSHIGPPAAVRILGGVVVVFGMSLVVGNLVIDPDGMTIVGGAIAVAAGLSAFGARLTLVLVEDRLRIRFVPFLTVALTRDQVRSVSVSRIDPARLGGVGIRRLGGARVLTLTAGSAVHLETAKGRLVVQVEDADTIVRALDAWIAGSDGGAPS